MYTHSHELRLYVLQRMSLKIATLAFLIIVKAELAMENVSNSFKFYLNITSWT
jgi:hypothetical protein